MGNWGIDGAAQNLKSETTLGCIINKRFQSQERKRVPISSANQASPSDMALVWGTILNKAMPNP